MLLYAADLSEDTYNNGGIAQWLGWHIGLWPTDCPWPAPKLFNNF